MTTYFNAEESIYSRSGNDVKVALETIAANYMGKNPVHPFVFRAYNSTGIGYDSKGRYDINLAEKFKNARYGQISYVLGKIWCDKECKNEYLINCYGPTRVFLNNRLLFKSSFKEEVNVNTIRELGVKFEKGWNTFLIKCQNTSSGFGCIFGAVDPKWTLLTLQAPFSEREGQMGWAFSEPVCKDNYDEEAFPDAFSCESLSGMKWYPEQEWDSEAQKKAPLIRLFGVKSGCSAFAWSKLSIPLYGQNECILAGNAEGPVVVWVDGVRVYEGKAGLIMTSVSLKCGEHDIFVKSISEEANKWSFALDATVNGIKCDFMVPYPVHGTSEKWLYIGPFDKDFMMEPPRDLENMHELHESLEGQTYWRLDSPDMWVRPFLENELFGRWNYPLGVTLYGLIKAGRILNREDITQYALEHIVHCTKFYRYAVWDKKKFGFANINNQLIDINMLDDCGSFGSTMLESYTEAKDDSILYIADLIAEHMRDKQERLSDGVFYREMKGHFMENTLWVDDLYMSTPFMARYYKLTDKKEYIDDAAKQFLLFKKYLFIPGIGVMSHVYDLKYKTPTFVPWGRGNGWAVYSLSEVLEILPQDHKDRKELINFFNELCEGILKLQGENGLWYQVLTQPDAYEEASCTSMFTYAFARGVRFGWLNDTNRYIKAVYKAWNGLTKMSIDKFGNIHGICRGSAYSFTPDYYKNELLWITNDTHGIGIVLQAGIEVSLLTE